MLPIFSKHVVPEDIQKHIFLQSSMLPIFRKQLVSKDIQQLHIFVRIRHVTNLQ